MKFQLKFIPFKLFTSETSIHGIRHIGDKGTHKIMRIFWWLSFALSIIGLSYYAYGTYSKWTIEPDIGITASLKPIREIPFVAATICSPVSAKNEFANYQDLYTHIVYEGHNHHVIELSSEK